MAQEIRFQIEWCGMVLSGYLSGNKTMDHGRYGGTMWQGIWTCTTDYIRRGSAAKHLSAAISILKQHSTPTAISRVHMEAPLRLDTASVCDEGLLLERPVSRKAIRRRLGACNKARKAKVASYVAFLDFMLSMSTLGQPISII